MSRTKRLLRRGVPVVVSAAALASVLRSIDVDKAFATLTWDVGRVLIPAFLGYGLLTLVLEAASILRLVEPCPNRFGLWTSARIKSASYLLGIINYTLGAAASVVLLIASVDLLVLGSIAALAATLAVTSAIGENDARVVLGTALAIGALGFFGGLAVLRTPRRLGPLDRIRQLAVFEALRDTPIPRLGELAVLRLLFTSSFIALGGLAFFAFGITPPLSEVIVGMVFIGVVAALPIAIAGLGTVQVAIVAFFGTHSDRETLVALSLLLTAGMILMRVGIGLLFAREFTRQALEETRAEAG